MLYNDFRPSHFGQVIGQPAAEVLLNFSMMVTDPEMARKIPHSMLISGKRGVGKTSLARLFAKAINCYHKGELVPCGECKSCRRYSSSLTLSGEHPDIIEIDSAASGSATSVQSLIEQMQLIPTFRRRVFIFDEAQMLTKSAMAMLLKVVEEPSRRTIIILLTTEPDRIDKMLRSRCTWLALRSLTQPDIVRLLARVCKAEKMPITKDALFRLAYYAEGSGRDALSVLETLRGYDQITIDLVEQVTGHRVNVGELVRCLNERDVNGALNEVQRLSNSYDPLVIADSMSDALIQQMRKMVDNQQPAPHVIKWIEAFQHCKLNRSATIPQLPLELAVTECAMAAEFIPPPAIMMNDVEAFAAYVRRASGKLAAVIEKLEYVRIKKDHVVLFRTDLGSLHQKVERAIEHFMRKYLRDDKLELEIIYGD